MDIILTDLSFLLNKYYLKLEMVKIILAVFVFWGSLCGACVSIFRSQMLNAKLEASTRKTTTTLNHFFSSDAKTLVFF